MSCHDIGRGMNSVVRTTITLMEQEKISKSAAKTIIACCAESVNWCDGNPYEATAYISKCLCGNCMNRIPAGKKLYSVYDLSGEVSNRYKIAYLLANDRLCDECFDTVVNNYCNDHEAGARERKYIEEHCKPEEYTSTGEYEDSNNGCRWVDYNLP